MASHQSSHALEVDTSSTDPALAWGTAQPVIRRLSIIETDELVPGDHAVSARTAGVRRPLGEDGDTAPAILDAAHELGIDVIVTAVRPQGWLAKLFSGSAAQDLLDTSDIPVLMINRRAGTASRSEPLE